MILAREHAGVVSRALARLGGNPAGAVCAAILFYVTIGNLIGYLIAGPYDSKVACWPLALRDAVMVSDCTDPAWSAFWRYAVELPNYLLREPTVALLLLTSSADPSAYNVAIVTFMAGVFVIIAFVGFAAFYTYLRPAAWVLLALLAGQIVYFRLLTEYGERLFR